GLAFLFAGVFGFTSSWHYSLRLKFAAHDLFGLVVQVHAIRAFAFNLPKPLWMDAFWNGLSALLGLGVDPKNLNFLQISIRGIIVLLTTLVMLRLGHKRSLARKTAFDAVPLVLLASVLSRA